MPDNPHNLTHSVIQDEDGRYEVKLYRHGRACGGASGHHDEQSCVDAAYKYFNKKEMK